MCGILGVATVRGRALSVDARTLERMRDTMRHRGPDGAGLWVHEHVALAHRRLVVVDPSEAAAQPLVTPDGRYAITYNGELYNDAELRAELMAEGVRFRTASDTETVLSALAVWGPRGLARLRGMYALGLYDTVDRTLLLARDPLGIKPLYYAVVGAAGIDELVFASEPRAILAHPSARARPDLVTVSAYLTTIRTVMGTRTLFEGVRTLRPGQAVMFELGADRIEARPLPGVMTRVAEAAGWSGDVAAGRVREVVEDSVKRHLRSDVPVCCLLSGGLDSSIVAAVARQELGELWTYCSGALGGGAERGDFEFARQVSVRIETRHTEAPVSREMFRDRWREMVGAMGVPLSTPNEVAINEVARRLRADGKIVTFSGEGADELFGGYEAVMRAAAEFEGVAAKNTGADLPALDRMTGGHHQLHANAWTPVESKPGLLRPEVWRAVEQDDALLEFYRVEFDGVLAESGAGQRQREAEDPMERLQPHLCFQRRINLAGLLQRLDTAMMLEGVESRTPFADSEVCVAAEALRMGEKFTMGTGAPGACETKRVLRRAFAAGLPREVVERQKASFPLPFQEWLEDSASALRESSFAKEVFTEAAVEMVAQRPGELWRFAWPMVNLAMWGRVWWG